MAKTTETTTKPDPGSEWEDAPAPASAPTKPGKRPVADIQRELDAAKAELQDMMPMVEGDTTKIRNQAGRIEAAKVQWKMDHPDEPFDPDIAGVNLRPFKGNADLQKAFHRQHYVVARLENELKDADPAF
jgi:hypothetical protein